ncbi:MAG TPA: hypothetical protein VEK57_31250 [Thermoanaerobaculia bacterium]|nr:hypothetical protein [Thermoanaerobaculia bacterium]
MLTLQNRWYNAFTGALGLNRGLAQLLQPAALLDGTDTQLWSLQDIVPPESLMRDGLTAASRFFAEYAAVIQQLEFPQSLFAQNIGAANYAAWSAYLQTLKPQPAAAQLPGIFRTWAMRHAPSVVSIGVADLTAMALYASAQSSLLPYEGSHPKPVDYSGTYAQLIATLDVSGSQSLSSEVSRVSADVNDTWTGGIDEAPFGLWLGNSASSTIARKFAASHVTVQASFDALLVWMSTPGAWYNSSALNAAYSSPATPPWPPDPDPTWEEMFGPGGALLYAEASLIVVSGISMLVTTDAPFTRSEQHAIAANANRGTWPFYLPSTSTVELSGRATAITTSVPKGTAVVLGQNVPGIGAYLGHGPSETHNVAAVSGR